jgi:putative ABC transport system permease protein
MRWSSRTWQRIKCAWRRRDLEQDLEDELRFHLEMKMQTGADAHQAHRSFGNYNRIKDTCREIWSLGSGEIWWQDFRYALRMMRKDLAFTTVAVVTLALGVGANTTIFSVVNAVLLRELPYRDADRLAMVWTAVPQKGLREQRASVPDFEDWKKQGHSLEDMAFYTGSYHLTLTDPLSVAEPDVIWMTLISDNFLQVLGVAPVVGRGISAEEAAAGERVALMSYDLWQRRYGAAVSIVGRTVDLDGRSYRVVGVMPREFRFPEKRFAFWAPAATERNWSKYRTERRSGVLAVFGRLRPGVTMEETQAEFSALSAALEHQYPDTNTGRSANVVPFQAQLLGKTVPSMLYVLLGAVTFVLLIACANVANLLLARGAARAREFAVRTALGAGRWRLIRQMLTESAALALLGAGLGLPLAAWGVDAVIRLAPQDIPRLDQVAIDGRVLAFTLLLSMLSAFAFGVPLALNTSRSDPQASLTMSSRASGGVGARAWRRVLVLAEIGLAVVLLTGAALLLRSFLLVRAVDPGFNANRMLIMRLNLRDPGFLEQAQERVRALPGVEAVAMMNNVMSLDAELRSDARFWTPTSGDAFRTLGIPLVRGRLFESRDEVEGAPPAVIVNETMARQTWPGEDPIGKTIPFAGHSFTVVGVVRDIRNAGLERQPVSQIFPAPSGPQPKKAAGWLVVRARGEPLALVPLIQSALRTLDSRATVWGAATLDQQLEQQTSSRRFQSYLLGLFSGLALALAGVGIYGVVHYSVAQRRQEIGIRMALGARAGSVLGMVLREGMSLALAGVGVGLLGALWMSTAIARLLYGVTPQDPMTFAGVAALLLAVALVACLVPARRATRVDPITVLRCE